MKSNIFNRNIAEGGCHVFETITTSFRSQWHSHPEHELVFINKGEGCLKYGNTYCDYKAGTLFLLGPWIPHEFIEKSKDHHSFSCIFTANLLSLNSFRCNSSQRILRLMKDTLNGAVFELPTIDQRELSHKIFTIHENEGVLQAIQIFLLLEFLSGPTIGYLPLSNIEEQLSNAVFYKRYEVFQDILYYINSNISQKITLDDLTERFYISKSTLARLFSTILQTNLTYYIQQQRLFYACRLLATTDDSITSIGEQVGFTSISSFNRYFLRFKNMSPREYRNQSKKPLDHH